MVTILAFAGLLAFLVVSIIGCALLLRVLAEVAMDIAQHAVAKARRPRRRGVAPTR